MFSATSAVLATQGTGHKITICHATSSETHPYTSPTVDIASAGYPDGDNGHAGHTGPVWYPGAKADGVDWGDIIPAYTQGNFSFPGLNWDDAGKAIYDNDCKVPNEKPRNPSIDLEKTPSVDSLPAGGGDVTYNYLVINTGDVPLSDVTVIDDKCDPVTYFSGDTNADGMLDLTETWTFTCDATLTETTENYATATGYDGKTKVEAMDEATVTVADRMPDISVDKTPSVDTLPAGGGDVTYTYVVTNTGNVPLSNVTVDDNKCSPVDYVSGDTNSNDMLDLTETWTFTCDATLTETTTNHAHATGYDGNTPVWGTDDATVTVLPAEDAPAINVVKTPSVDSLPAGGGDVTYTYVVTNTGNVPLSNVAVSDDKCSPVDYVSGDTNTNDMLDLTESWTFTCDATLTETTTNTATATGQNGEQTVTDTDDATVPVAGLHDVDTPAISIVKTADPTTLPVGGGDVTYTYVVENTGNVPVFDVNVRDDNGTSADTSDDFDATCPKDTLAVGESMTCTADVEGITETTTNVATATANWDSCHDDCSTAVPPATDDATVTVTPPGGGVGGETNVPAVPTAPSTDTLNSGTAGNAGGALPLLLIVLGVIGLGAVLLTPRRARR